MTHKMVKAMAQHFMDVHLIENAADWTSNLFKDREVYMLTPKGLHILECFITKNGMSANCLLKVLLPNWFTWNFSTLSDGSVMIRSLYLKPWSQLCSVAL